MRVLQIVYFFVVGIPIFILAYCVIETADLAKKIANVITR
jgi:hypothetical protein